MTIMMIATLRCCYFTGLIIIHDGNYDSYEDDDYDDYDDCHIEMLLLYRFDYHEIYELDDCYIVMLLLYK